MQHSPKASLALAALAALAACVAPPAAHAGSTTPYFTDTIVFSGYDRGESTQVTLLTLHNPVGSPYSFSNGVAAYEKCDVGNNGYISYYDSNPIDPPPTLLPPTAAYNAGDSAGGRDVGFFSASGPAPGSTEQFLLDTTNYGPPLDLTASPIFLFATALTPDLYNAQMDFSSFSRPLADYGPISVALPTPDPVPEASSVVSLGLMLALALGGVVIARKRCKTGSLPL